MPTLEVMEDTRIAYTLPALVKGFNPQAVITTRFFDTAALQPLLATTVVLTLAHR